MKNQLLFILFFIVNQVHCQFLGGKNNGNDISFIHGTRLNGEIASFAVLYQGNSGDGFDSQTNQLLLSSSNFEIYEGGSGDGFVQKKVTATINGNIINSLYFGNFGDGHSKEKLQSVLTGETLSIIFKGNNGDGADKNLLNSVFLEGLVLSIFNGGYGDGFSTMLKPNNYLTGLMLMLYNGGNGDGYASNILRSALTLDVVEHLIKIDVLLYPNPANHMVTLEPSDGVEIKSIKIYDVLGKKIKLGVSDNNTLNVSSLSDGIYLINIFSNTGSISKKLIIKK